VTCWVTHTRWDSFVVRVGQKRDLTWKFYCSDKSIKLCQIDFVVTSKAGKEKNYLIKSSNTAIIDLKIIQIGRDLEKSLVPPPTQNSQL